MCIRNIELVQLTWRSYISGNDTPNRPTETSALRNIRAELKEEGARWVKLRSHYEASETYAHLKSIWNIYFENGVEWLNL